MKKVTFVRKAKEVFSIISVPAALLLILQHIKPSVVKGGRDNIVISKATRVLRVALVYSTVLYCISSLRFSL